MKNGEFQKAKKKEERRPESHLSSNGLYRPNSFTFSAFPQFNLFRRAYIKSQ
tara:strand:+ start:42773 stop:42928 length:156 start_codon:yes stop_codon:yes gene_type:complete